jgi:hypothetical protein
LNPADAERPTLERQIAAIAGEHDVRGLVEQGANPSIATLRDAARVVDLLRFPAPGHKPQIRADVPRRAEAIRSVDGGDKGERRQLADPGSGHQPPAGLRRACQTPYLRTPDLKDPKAVIEALN